jgi:cytochrome P450
MRSLIAQKDPKEHLRRRKPWTKGFSTSAIKEYEPIVSARVQQLADKLATQSGAINLTQWLCWFA